MKKRVFKVPGSVLFIKVHEHTLLYTEAGED